MDEGSKFEDRTEKPRQLTQHSVLPGGQRPALGIG